MGDPTADRKKAMAAVQAMFDRYKLLAARRPKDHIVRAFFAWETLSSNSADSRQDFDQQVMENLKIVDAGLDGSVAYELYIAPNFSNLNSTAQRMTYSAMELIGD